MTTKRGDDSHAPNCALMDGNRREHVLEIHKVAGGNDGDGRPTIVLTYHEREETLHVGRDSGRWPL